MLNFIGGNVAKLPSTSLLVTQSGVKTEKMLCLIRTDEIIMHFKNPKLKQQEEGNLQFIKTTQCVCKDIMFLGEGYRYIFECKDGIIFSYEVTRTDYAERAIDVGQTVYAQVTRGILFVLSTLLPVCKIS